MTDNQISKEKKPCIHQTFLQRIRTILSTKEDTESDMNLTKRIGNTIYNVKITVADDDGTTMEDSILHMIQNLPLATDGKSGIMNVPLTSCLQPERMET